MPSAAPPSGLTLALTGATGFVGGHALAHALAQGHRVRALTRRPQPPRDGVAWVAGDLANGPALDRLVAHADAIVHVAGVTNARDAAGFVRANVEGTAALRRAAGARPFLLVSSLAARAPWLSVYGASKRQAEDVARGVGGPLAIVRPPAVYGPNDREVLELLRIAQRTGRLPGPAGQRTAMIYGPDLAAALVALAADLAGPAPRSAGGTFEIDDGAGFHDGPALAVAMARALGRPVRSLPLAPALLHVGALIDTGRARLTGTLPRLSRDRARYMSAPDWSADSSALLALGLWAPQTPLDQGLAATVAWARAEGLL